MVSLYKLKRAEEYESGLKTCFESENHNMNTFHTFKSKTILFCSKKLNIFVIISSFLHRIDVLSLMDLNLHRSIVPFYFTFLFSFSRLSLFINESCIEIFERSQSFVLEDIGKYW